LVIGVVLLGCTDAARAQSQDAPAGAHRFTVSAGLAWLGGYPIGSNTATLRRNEPGTTTPSAFTLFQADTSLDRAFGVDARFSIAFTRDFDAEIGGGYSQPRLAASVSADPESDPAVLSDQRLTQVTVDGSLIWRVPGIDLGSRTTPYVIGGVGYLRQIDEDRVRVETGTVGHIGGGVRYWVRGGDGTRRALGIRGEARLQLRSGGVEFEDKRRMFPAVNLLGTFGF
jgi:hypothetical protein